MDSRKKKKIKKKKKGLRWGSWMFYLDDETMDPIWW